MWIENSKNQAHHILIEHILYNILLCRIRPYSSCYWVSFPVIMLFTCLFLLQSHLPLPNILFVNSSSEDIGNICSPSFIIIRNSLGQRIFHLFVFSWSFIRILFVVSLHQIITNVISNNYFNIKLWVICSLLHC